MDLRIYQYKPWASLFRVQITVKAINLSPFILTVCGSNLRVPGSNPIKSHFFILFQDTPTMMMKNTFTWTRRMWLAVLYSLELVSSRVSLSLVSLTMPTMESLLARNSQWEAFKTVIFVHLYFYLLNIYKNVVKSVVW